MYLVNEHPIGGALLADVLVYIYHYLPSWLFTFCRLLIGYLLLWKYFISRRIKAIENIKSDVIIVRKMQGIEIIINVTIEIEGVGSVH